MTTVQIGKIRDDIIGVKPIYTEIGNSTLLYLKAGDILDERSSRSVVGAMFQSYGIDQKAQRRNLKDVLHRHGVMPFYFEKRVFVPLKMRKPVAEKDMAYGYVDLGHVEEVESVGRRECTLFLTDGRSIAILSSRNTVLQSLDMGRRLLAYLQGNQTRPPDDEEAVRAVRGLICTLRTIQESLLRIEECIAEDRQEYD